MFILQKSITHQDQSRDLVHRKCKGWREEENKLERQDEQDQSLEDGSDEKPVFDGKLSSKAHKTLGGE